MSKLVTHRQPDDHIAGFPFTLEPGLPLRAPLGFSIAVFVDKQVDDAGTPIGDRFRFVLTVNDAEFARFNQPAGSQGPIAFGWTLTHNATTYNDDGSVASVDIDLN